MNALPSLIADTASSLWVWGFSFAFMTALELLLSDGDQSLVSRLPGLLFWTIWLPVSSIIGGVSRVLWAELGIHPLIQIPLDFTWTGAASIVAAPLAAAMVYDFFFYWYHRAQHRWFWRFHAVHHSIRDVNTINAYHHITEPLFQSVLILLPMSLIVGKTGTAAPLIILFLYFQSSFIHSPVRFHFGRARMLLVDNRFHRIHHSKEERHFDRNFGAFTTVWDRIFGTAHFPEKNEWPDTGLAGIDQPRTLREWISLPYRYGRAPKMERSAA